MILIPPYIKFVVWAIFVLSGIGLLLIYVLPTNTPPAGRADDSTPIPAETVLLTGIVKEFGSNRNGDIDQLLLQNADGENRVRFPPHTAKQIMHLAPAGTTVSVLVHAGSPHPPGPAGNASPYQLEQLQAGNTVLPIAGIPPPPPAAGKPLEINGTVDSLITGTQGQTTGFIVNGFRIALPPHLAQSIAPLLQQGKPISIKGYERTSNDGFVNTGQHTLIKPYRMTIDSTDYLL